MNLPYFIAKRLIKGKDDQKSFSKPINVIAIVGIALGLAVMIISVAVLTGFKKEIREKIVGFGGNIQIVNYDSNISYETSPIRQGKEFVDKIKDFRSNPYRGLRDQSGNNKYRRRDTGSCTERGRKRFRLGIFQ